MRFFVFCHHMCLCVCAFVCLGVWVFGCLGVLACVCCACTCEHARALVFVCGVCACMHTHVILPREYLNTQVWPLDAGEFLRVFSLCSYRRACRAVLKLTALTHAHKTSATSISLVRTQQGPFTLADSLPRSKWTVANAAENIAYWRKTLKTTQ